MSARLSLQDLGVRAGEAADAPWLLRGLTLSLQPGDWAAVIGRSGAGKSSLLRTIVGLRAPAHGTVALDDHALASLPPRTRARTLAYLPQHAEPWLDLRAEEVVSLGRTPHLGALAHVGATQHAAVLDAMARAQATALRGRRWSSLSGGERQRIMLARMLATEARVLVLDEPTTGLDVGAALQVLHTCAALVEAGATVVMAMHDLELAGRFARTIVCLGERGAVPRVGAPAEVLVPEHVAAAFGVEVELAPRMVFALPRPPATPRR